MMTMIRTTAIALVLAGLLLGYIPTFAEAQTLGGTLTSIGNTMTSVGQGLQDGLKTIVVNTLGQVDAYVGPAAKNAEAWTCKTIFRNKYAQVAFDRDFDVKTLPVCGP